MRGNTKRLYVIPKVQTDGAGADEAGTGGAAVLSSRGRWAARGTRSAHAHRLDVLGLVVQLLAQFHGCLLLFEPQDPVSRSSPR